MASTVHEQIVLPARPETIWPLLTEAEHIAAWYAFGGAEVDPRPGGAMVLRWDEHGSFPATVRTVEPQHRFTFEWHPLPGPVVEFALTPQDGGTRVDITETGELDDPDTSAMAWRNSLDLLRQLAAEI
ncbi:SRPBCC domain-containing protein [Nocardia altamirensis]|uniref:SRPBCC domain-containing protein n=1 Tax=Nocardia altamirensis TaxID=472158 RepID=UPI0008400E56|nr:SRPBCC domain-containing protein [Nocardia altamirensis]